MNEEITVFVEIPKGSRNKYELDHKTGQLFLDRMLFSSVHYPADYGFIPNTLARDGDELDVLVLVAEPTFPGCMVKARPVGMLNMWDEKGPDEKILSVPLTDPQWNWAKSLDDIPSSLMNEISHFFEVYKDLEAKITRIGEWSDREEALRVIEEARARFRS